MPTIYIPSLANEKQRCVNQIEDVSVNIVLLLLLLLLSDFRDLGFQIIINFNY